MAAERVPSEHELRVQRSLQRLNVPDWYKNSPAARDGFRLKRHSDASQHSGWRSLGSKTTSLSSLSSSSNLRQPSRGMRTDNNYYYCYYCDCNQLIILKLIKNLSINKIK